MTSTRGVKLDSETIKRLEALATLRDRSPHWLMRHAIQFYLDREEHYEREKREDMERWQQYQLTGHAIPHEKAATWLTSLANGKDAACPQ